MRLGSRFGRVRWCALLGGLPLPRADLCVGLFTFTVAAGVSNARLLELLSKLCRCRGGVPA